jgi:hypothetical protein
MQLVHVAWRVQLLDRPVVFSGLLLTPSLKPVFLSVISTLHQNLAFRALIVFADALQVLISSTTPSSPVYSETLLAEDRRYTTQRLNAILGRNFGVWLSAVSAELFGSKRGE